VPGSTLKSNYEDKKSNGQDNRSLSEVADVQQNIKEAFYWLISRPSVSEGILKSNYEEHRGLSEDSDVQQSCKQSFYWLISRPSVSGRYLE
jgi:hypothetical protein